MESKEKKIMAAKSKDIQEQSRFCKELADRLNKDILKVTNVEYYGSPMGHTTLQNDIIRLRRELMELSKMFDWDYGKY